MVITRSQVDGDMIELCLSLSPSSVPQRPVARDTIAQGTLAGRVGLVSAIRQSCIHLFLPQEAMERVRDTFDLFQSSILSHRPQMEHSTISWGDLEDINKSRTSQEGLGRETERENIV